MEFPPLDFDRVRTYPIRERPNKVHLDELASAWKPGGSFAQFLESLPRILTGNDFRAIVDATVSAVRHHRPVVVMMGAHTIKCGLNPIFLDLMKRGVISAISSTARAPSTISNWPTSARPAKTSSAGSTMAVLA